MGYTIDVVLNLLTYIRKKNTSLQSVFKKIPLASFLGLYAALFRACSCILRACTDKDRPALYGALSGVAAGPAFYFFKSKTVAIYLFCKMVEAFILRGVELKYLPNYKHGGSIAYATALGIILHAAWLEPHNLKRSYYDFLIGVSGNKFPLLWRKVVDHFGTKASTMYPDFIPNLDMKYVTHPDIVSIVAKK